MSDDEVTLNLKARKYLMGQLPKGEKALEDLLRSNVAIWPDVRGLLADAIGHKSEAGVRLVMQGQKTVQDAHRRKMLYFNSLHYGALIDDKICVEGLKRFEALEAIAKDRALGTANADKYLTAYHQYKPWVEEVLQDERFGPFGRYEILSLLSAYLSEPDVMLQLNRTLFEAYPPPSHNGLEVE